MTALAGLVLLSALAVPIGAEQREAEEDGGKGRNSRLTALLGLTKMPTRQGLLKDALSRNILKSCPVPIQTLYGLLETSFDPLALCASAAPALQVLAGSPDVGSSTPLVAPTESSFAPYVPLLHNVILARLISQLSQVYSSVQISFVIELVGPLSAASLPNFEEQFPNTVSCTKDESSVEAFIMLAARRGELRVRIDHAEGTLDFNADESTQSVFDSNLRSLADALHHTLVSLSPSTEARPGFEDLVAAAVKERKALAVRRALVAKRREQIAELQSKQEQEAAAAKAVRIRKEKEDEEKRAIEDVKRREQERVRKELESIRVAETRKIAEALKAQGRDIDMQQIEQMDKGELLDLQVHQIDKEKREHSERLRIVSKRVDHWERALRRAELPLLEQDLARQQVDDRKTWENNAKSTVETAREHHKQEVQTKKRLARMFDDYIAAREIYAGKRGEEFAKRREEARRKIEEEKAKRKKNLLARREEERKRREEEERLEREEEERIAAERAGMLFCPRTRPHN